jgi:hypothetical protein
MSMEHKGNAQEKIDDAIQALLMLLRILDTSQITTDDLKHRLKLIGQDLENAKFIVGLI